MNIFFEQKNNFLWSLLISFYIGMIIFLFLSLRWYNPVDSSWFYVSSDSTVVTNQCGSVGAHVAAILFYFFGGASFLLIIPLLFIGLLFFTNITIKKEWERLIACLYLTFGGAALLALYGIDYVQSSYPGGRVGLFLISTLTYYFDSIGCGLFLYTSLLATFILLFRWSFMFLIHYLVTTTGIVCELLAKYQVVRKCVNSIIYCLFFIFIIIPRFFIHFIKSLLDGSAFEDTNLMYPEDRDELKLISEDCTLLVVPSPGYLILSLCKKNLRPHSLKISYALLLLLPKISGEVKGTQKKLYKYKATNKLLKITKLSSPKKSKMIKKALTYVLPPKNIFRAKINKDIDYNLEKELEDRAYILEDKLKRFGVQGNVIAIKRGPVVTLFEYQPHADTKLSKIIVLEDDLAMALQAMSIRIIAPIPGKSVVGFEVSNTIRHDVLFSDVINQSAYKQCAGHLLLVLGKDTIGDAVVVDLVTMPHLLIAGSTGSGKSVTLNAILISLLCRLNPFELKLILIDPKRLEFAAFTDIAHLLFPIVTNPAHAILALRWVVQEMEDRYEKMSQCGVRNIIDYNERIKNTQENTLPFIVVMIDELADLMITAGRDIEDLITRITQMARAAGIHMIVATQRPSVDVITGLIKANFPSRISFRVASRIDSRTILDTMGADRLLGRGDMLFLDVTKSQLRRVHGAYVSDEEIEDIVNHICSQKKVEYLDIQEVTSMQGQNILPTDDVLYKDIRLFLDEIDEVSISLLQRKFRIGYNRSARIIDALESQGLIMPQDGSKTRKVIR